MPSQTRYPGTITTDSSFGERDWTNPSNASGASDGSYAEALLSLLEPNSWYLKAINYGFSIPTGATITSVNYVPRVKASGASIIQDSRLRVVIGASIGSNDYSSGTSWPITDDDRSYDITAEGATVAQINAGDFGIAHSAKRTSGTPTTAYIDSMGITVSWTGGQAIVDPCEIDPRECIRPEQIRLSI